MKSPVGKIEAINQLSDGTIGVRGFAYDQGAPSLSVSVYVYVDGVLRMKAVADDYRADVNKSRAITGNHGFRVLFKAPVNANKVSVVAIHRAPNEPNATIGTDYLAGKRLVARAKMYIGRTPYVYAGSTPAGFDCSGFTMWVYKTANVATLPHQSEWQRQRVKLIPRSQARPGDLVFYGSPAYHVEIYAGGNMAYAATQPGETLRYRPFFGSVQFGTTWH